MIKSMNCKFEDVAARKQLTTYWSEDTISANQKIY
jgi:hypothetical protein